MERIKAAEIAEATGGEIIWGDPEAEVTGISIDSRTIDEGMAFFALKGERADGHDFLEDAIEAGCAALVVERGDNLPSNTACTSTSPLIKAGHGTRSAGSCRILSFFI